MLGTLTNKVNLFNITDVRNVTSVTFYLSIISQILIVFISWNYIGVIFIFYLCAIIKTINNYRNASFIIYFLNTFLYILIFHIGVLFWMFKIKYGIIGFFLSMIYYLIPFCCYFFFNKHIKQSLFAFIIIFSLFEIFLDISNFSFPWLIIGNSLSNSDLTPQIYQYIGSIGGSLLMLLIAFLIYRVNKNSQKLIIFLSFTSFLYIFGFSKLNFNQPKDNKKELINCLFFNPDKYIKYGKYYNNEELAFFIKNKINNKHYEKVFVPELTFRSISFRNFENSIVYDYIKEVCLKSKSQFYFGASGVVKKGNLSNIYVSTNGLEILKKTKEKLVPYTEYIPEILRKILKNNLSFDYTDYNTWKIEKTKTKELPIICYEIIYSDYVNNNIKNTGVMILLTSEKFLNNSSFGENQYNNIIKLRAIETRKPIIKSSNAGLSYYMNKFGIIEKSTNNEFSNMFINKNDFNFAENTFYTNFVVKNNILLILNTFLILIIILKK